VVLGTGLIDELPASKELRKREIASMQGRHGNRDRVGHAARCAVFEPIPLRLYETLLTPDVLRRKLA
jgi:hypothetical protein